MPLTTSTTWCWTRTSAGSARGPPRSSTSRTSGRRSTDDAHPASPVGAGDGLHRPPVLRLGERHHARARSATPARRPPPPERESRRLRAWAVRDVPRGALTERHPAVPRKRPPGRGELRRPVPDAAGVALVASRFPAARRAEHPRHPRAERPPGAVPRDHHGEARGCAETTADHEVVHQRVPPRRPRRRPPARRERPGWPPVRREAELRLRHHAAERHAGRRLGGVGLLGSRRR